MRTLVALSGITAENFPDDTSPGLQKATEAKGYTWTHVMVTSEATARAILLTIEKPALSLVDAWDHWVCVHAADATHVHYYDSACDGPIERTATWPDFLERASKWRGFVRWDFYQIGKRA